MASDKTFGDRLRRVFLSSGRAVGFSTLLLGLGLFGPDRATAQSGAAGAIPDSAAASDSLSLAQAVDTIPPPPPLPAYGILGVGYGNRSDACVLCESPQDNKSFTAHLSVGRPLGKGIGIGLAASVWRKGRPGTPVVADSTGVPTAGSLANMLGNASVSVSYRYWRFFAQAGGGVAFGSQDLEMTGSGGELLVHTATGWGIGYTAGAGFTVPVASMVSLAFFGNWNVGHYDMVSPQGLTERAAKHQYLEFGVGVGVW